MHQRSPSLLPSPYHHTWQCASCFFQIGLLFFLPICETIQHHRNKEINLVGSYERWNKAVHLQDTEQKSHRLVAVKRREGKTRDSQEQRKSASTYEFVCECIFACVSCTLWSRAGFMGARRAAFAPSAAVAVDRQARAKLSLHAVWDRRWVLLGLGGVAGGRRLCDPAGRAMAIT